MKNNYSVDGGNAKLIEDHLKTVAPPNGYVLRESFAVILHFVLVRNMPVSIAYSFLKKDGLTCSYQYFCRWVKNNINFDDYELTEGKVVRVDSPSSDLASASEDAAYKKALIKLNESRNKIEIDALTSKTEENSSTSSNEAAEDGVKTAGSAAIKDGYNKALLAVAESRKKMEGAFNKSTQQLKRHSNHQKR